MPDIFDPRVLRGVVENTPTPAAFLLNSFFRTIEQSEVETIEFHVVNGRRRLAPFVSPLVGGQVVQSQGYVANSFSPAYIKDKRVFDPSRGFKRVVGEAVGGNLSPQERIMACLARETADQIDMHTRRLEVMAAEALRTGKITVTGELYPTKVVDFQRKATLTKTLAGTARWGESAATPVKNLQDWAQEVFVASGRAPTDVVMTADAWELLKKDETFKEAIDTRLGNLMTAQMAIGPVVVGSSGARAVGLLGEMRLWMYADSYEDDDGTATEILPPFTVILTGAGLEGVRHFGAIKDEEAGLQALQYHQKTWVEKDPSVRFLLMQSAPLPVPYRVNAAACVTVH